MTDANFHRQCGLRMMQTKCEAFNSKLNTMFYHAHPHIFQLIEALFEMQDMSYLQMQSTDDVNIGPKESVIADYMNRLDQGDIDRITFVHDLVRKFLPPKIK